MRVLGIMGSPRRGGNSEILLDEFLRGAREGGCVTRKLAICEMNISPCRACDGCRRTGKCVIDDDMRIVYEEVGEADVICVSAPVYFMCVPSQLKAVIDRFQSLWITGGVRKMKRGFFISVGGQRWKKLSASVIVMKTFFSVIGASYDGEILVPGVDRAGEIKNRNDVMKRAFELGRMLTEL